MMMARKHIEEEILQMKCPRCRTAFYDFEGSFAIRCLFLIFLTTALVFENLAGTIESLVLGYIMIYAYAHVYKHIYIHSYIHNT